jgi:hypothetical protein
VPVVAALRAGAETRVEDVGVPDRIDVWTWPTAEVTGELVLVGTRYDLPAYVVQDAAEEIRIEDGEDVISWQEKDGSETQDPKP